MGATSAGKSSGALRGSGSRQAGCKGWIGHRGGSCGHALATATDECDHAEGHDLHIVLQKPAGVLRECA